MSENCNLDLLEELCSVDDFCTNKNVPDLNLERETC